MKTKLQTEFRIKNVSTTALYCVITTLGLTVQFVNFLPEELTTSGDKRQGIHKLLPKYVKISRGGFFRNLVFLACE